jgi:hypothetical protein
MHINHSDLERKVNDIILFLISSACEIQPIKLLYCLYHIVDKDNVSKVLSGLASTPRLSSSLAGWAIVASEANRSIHITGLTALALVD